MEKLNRQQVLSLPNGISIIRVLTIPVILVLLFYPERIHSFITMLFFLSVAITDTLDGYFARRNRMVTTLGKFLDPLADKLLIATTLIALIPARGIPAWIVIVIISREIAVTGLRGIAVSQGIVLSASPMGKHKMVFEVTSIAFLIFNRVYFSIDFFQVGMVLLWISMGVAVLSGIGYFKKFLRSIII